MFTGIIEAVGEVAEVEQRAGDMRFTIQTGTLDMSDVQLGDSIACNGVCLTVVALAAKAFTADVSLETVSLTGFRHYKKGQRLNLEKALTPQSRLGGHLVSGHVDGIGSVKQLWQDARSWRFVLEAPESLARYIAHKGSITVDGTSLTVNKVEGNQFELNIVPHTIEHTIMGDYQIGTEINLEVDQIARYLERLIEYQQPGKTSEVTEQLLQQHGYIK